MTPDASLLKAYLEDRGFNVGDADTVPDILTAFDVQLAAVCQCIEDLSSLGYRRGKQPGPALPPKPRVEPVL